MSDSTSPTMTRRSPPPLCRRLLRGVAIGLLSLGCALSVEAEPDTLPITIGFTRSIFKNRNQNDMLAAMKVWAQTLATERGVNLNSDMLVYDDVDQAMKAVRGKEVDALILLLSEHATFPEGLLSGPYFRDRVNGETLQEYVLLSRKDGDVQDLADVRGVRMSVHDDRYAALGIDWLDAQLVGAGIGPSPVACASIESNPKLSAAVLSVFFKKNDACLVSRRGFENMCELNPQVARQLEVIAISPAVVPSVCCFREDVDQEDKDRLYQEVLRLEESITGEQVLSVFKSDGMSEVTAEELARSTDLMAAWQTVRSDELKLAATKAGSAK